MKDSNESESWKWVKWRVSRMSTFINKGDCSTTTRHYSDLVDKDGMKCFAKQGGGQTRGGLDRMWPGPDQGPGSHMQSCPLPQVLAPLYWATVPNNQTEDTGPFFSNIADSESQSHNLYLTLSFVLDVIIICWLWVIIDQSYQPYLIITIHVSIAKQNHCISAKALTLAQSLSLRTD